MARFTINSATTTASNVAELPVLNVPDLQTPSGIQARTKLSIVATGDDDLVGV